MQPTAVIRHPDHPERFVEVRKLDRVDEYDIEVARAALAQPVAIVDPISGEYVRLGKDGQPDSKGEIQTVVLRRPVPMKLLCAELAKRITRWGGIVDADGAVLECKPENVIHLYQRWNDVQDKDGVRTFAHYIEREIERPDLFDKDPSGNS